MRPRFTGLWRHPNFLKLWAGQSISVFGSAIGSLAVSLTAALTLQATPVQMGFLQAAGWIPSLLALFAGAWVDRRRRRPILILTDLGRAILLLAVPVATALHALRIEMLYVVALLAGMLGILFNVAYQSFLPSLVQRERLVEANSKLTMSASAAQVAGPGLAGAVVQLVTAPVAILADALSFLISALFLGLIHVPEPAPTQQGEGHSIWREIGEGLRLVMGNPFLRAIAGYNATANIFWSMQLAVFVLYLTRELRIEAAWLGIIFASINVGTLVAPLLASRAAHRFGLGRTIVGAPMVSYVGAALIPLAHGPMPLAIPLLVAGQFLIGLGLVVYEINQVSLRQAVTPGHMLGRMSASMRFITWAITPVGALIGGFLAQRIGLRPTLVVAAAGLWLAVPWAVFSPLLTLTTGQTPENPSVEGGIS